MEVSDVRRRIRAAIDAARARAAERRARTDEASRAYDQFLETIAVPAFHTVVNALTGEGHRFKVITPGRAVRMSPERRRRTSSSCARHRARPPAVVIRSSRGRGRRMVSTERILREDLPIAELAEEDVVARCSKRCCRSSSASHGSDGSRGYATDVTDHR